MDEIILEFNITINVSLQIGDVLFYKDISQDKIYQIGSVKNINGSFITTEINAKTPRPENGDFIFFAKDSEINTSGIIGPWASVKMELSGSENKELYSVSTEVFKSS